ncbi:MULTISPECIES: hypothetical protein [unclassified Ornithinimicrobium]|uniref:hypothetical protein n=1 Tax=unclassified Ornithinimicrobium TaxID=2615080 RepID=UPI0038551A91
MAVTSPAAAPTARSHRGVDGSLVAFFAIAFALARGPWLVVAQTADQAGIETDHLLRLAEERRLASAVARPGVESVGPAPNGRTPSGNSRGERDLVQVGSGLVRVVYRRDLERSTSSL